MVNIVPPMTSKEIRHIAIGLRQSVKLKQHQPFPTLDIIERLNNISAVRDREILRLVEDEELPHAHGTYHLKEGVVTLRNSCYLGALENDPECLFTTNHEFAHMLLHSDSSLHRIDSTFTVPEEMCPEIQADSLAIELSLDFKYLRKSLRSMSIDQIADEHRLPRQKLDEHITRLIRAGDLQGQQLSLNF